MGSGIDAYSDRYLIGSGAFGDVYEAKRRADGARCALKVLRRAQQSELARFHREIQIQARLQHKNIVPIWAYSLDSQPYFFVMPLAEESLRRQLDLGTFGPEQLFIIEHIALGLIHAHQQKVIHRDLSPENVLLFREGDEVNAAIADFGLGRSLRSSAPSLTETNRRMGKFAYAAPEQLHDAKRADERSDIYSLGKVLLELLTGKNPHGLTSLEAPAPFRFIIQKATEQTPERRFQTVAEMLDALRKVTTGSHSFKKPVDAVRADLSKLLTKKPLGARETEEVARLLLLHLDDPEVLHDVVPQLPLGVFQALLLHQRETVESIFVAYDQSVSGALDFEYCDVVANFYAQLFPLTDWPPIRQRIIQRLALLGFRHNRYYVGDTLKNLIKKTSDISEFMALRDVLAGNPSVAAWCAPYLQRCSLPPIIRAVLPKERLQQPYRSHWT
ncbi:MAG TPA: serine/threonine-protein kinase [Myxococcus sp.]|nr:serine/threonine-protein kinase [Myxococcus sp.]